jgi:hypothetical protein
VLWRDLPRVYSFQRAGRYTFVLTGWTDRSILVFRDRKMERKIPVTDYAHVEKVLALPGGKVALVCTYVISIFEGDHQQGGFQPDVWVLDAQLLSDSTMILLGHKDGFIFHVVDLQGRLIRRFGVFPEMVDPKVGPSVFCVDGDTIYVAGVNSYTIYRYVNGLLQGRFVHPDSTSIRGPVREIVGGVARVYRLAAINGMVCFKDRLYVSTFVHKPVSPREAHSVFSVDVFSKRDGTLLRHMPFDSLIVPVDKDDKYLYLMHGRRIERWRE